MPNSVSNYYYEIYSLTFFVFYVLHRNKTLQFLVQSPKISLMTWWMLWQKALWDNPTMMPPAGTRPADWGWTIRDAFLLCPESNGWVGGRGGICVKRGKEHSAMWMQTAARLGGRGGRDSCPRPGQNLQPAALRGRSRPSLGQRPSDGGVHST